MPIQSFSGRTQPRVECYVCVCSSLDQSGGLRAPWPLPAGDKPWGLLLQSLADQKTKKLSEVKGNVSKECLLGTSIVGATEECQGTGQCGQE